MADIITTGDIRVDGVFAGEPFRWNAGSPLGTPVTVTYSFPTAPLSYASEATLVNGWRAFTTTEQQAARDLFAYVSSFTKLTFQEVAATDQSYGQVVLQFNTQSQSSGFANYPYDADLPKGSALAGDIYIAKNDFTSFDKGQYGWLTLAHELGHALGMKHLGNYNAGEPDGAANNTGPYLDKAFDSYQYSIMSYSAPAQGQFNITYSIYDVLALRAVYGTNLTHTGTDVYAYSDVNGRVLQTIIDDGGLDTIDASGATLGAKIDLTPGAFSSIGKADNGNLADRNVAIAFGSTIEKAIGTAFDDIITGNAARNTFTGGRGNDTINGGDGLDISMYSGARGSYTLSVNGGQITVTDKTATDGIDTLTAVERLKFTDGMLAFDFDGVAGQTYRLYQAAFKRTPDTVGLSHNVNLMDNGTVDIKGMSAAFIASAEFQQRYGASLSDADFIRLLYNNVLGRDPDAAGAAGWATRLADGSWDRPGVLFGFSESGENKALVQSAIANGILLDLGVAA